MNLIQLLSVAFCNFLLWLGVDMLCICGHRYSDHGFDAMTPTGFCQNGDFNTGCSCMVYEVKGSRATQDRRGDPSQWK